MVRRLLLFMGMLTISASLAQAQPSQGVGMTDACKTSANETEESLKARKARLEQLIKQAGQRDTPAVATAKEDLMEVLFQLECVKSWQPVSAKRGLPKRSGPTTAAAKKDLVEVTTYYATNRVKSGGTALLATYDPVAGVKPASTFHYGRTVVSIPSTHREGEIERPQWWRLQLQADPTQHFVVKEVVPFESMDAARKEMAAKIKDAKSKAALVFVHGYNTSFNDAAMRTAQIVYDLKFPGMPFFFSWPSAGKVRAYLPDEDTARLSEAVFEALIDDLQTLPFTDVYIVAHSMGTRVVSHALQRRVLQRKPNKNLREVMLAAPDINAQLFTDEIAPRLKEIIGLRTTLYASSWDLALVASKVAHGWPRVGETSNGVFTFPGLETVDASAIANSVLALGHSYVVDTPVVIEDIKKIVGTRMPVSQRGLVPAGVPPSNYWKIVPPPAR